MSIAPKIFLIPLMYLLGACTLYAGEDSNSEGWDAGYAQDANPWVGDASIPSDDAANPWIEDAGPPWQQDDASTPWYQDAGTPWTEDAGPPWTEDAGPPWIEDAGSPWIEDAGPPWTEDAGPPVDDCATITSEGICVVSGCEPLYSGINCVCDANGCQCEQWVFDSCE